MMKTTRRYIVEAQVCGTCCHYHQHYVLEGDRFRPLWYGHCHAQGRRHPLPDGTCPRYQARRAGQ